MGLLSKKTIRILGIVFTTLFLICAIVAIILSGISYKFAGPDFVSNPYYALPGLEIATIIFTFVIAVFGYLTFIKPNIGLTIAFSVLLMISILFNIAIAVLALVGGSTGWVNTYFGCNTPFSGVLNTWHGVDAYLHQADMRLCSQQCPCYITNVTGYVTNSTIKPYYDSWEKTTVAPGNVAFQNCSSAVQSIAYTEAKRLSPIFDKDNTFVSSSFMDYMYRVENEFQCTGWCDILYTNTNLNKRTLQYKYLFTNVNRGPPVHLGCLDQIIQWLPPYLLAWGSVVMVLLGLQIVVFTLALCQCWAREKDHEHQIPHHHDDARR